MTKLTTGQNPRIRVALLTLAVSPVRGSECAVSWNYITRMSRYVDMTVIYPKYQQEVEQWLADNPLQGVKFINVPIGELPPERGIKQDLADYRNVKQWHRDVFPPFSPLSTIMFSNPLHNFYSTPVVIPIPINIIMYI